MGEVLSKMNKDKFVMNKVKFGQASSSLEISDFVPFRVWVERKQTLDSAHPYYQRALCVISLGLHWPSICLKSADNLKIFLEETENECTSNDGTAIFDLTLQQHVTCEQVWTSLYFVFFLKLVSQLRFNYKLINNCYRFENKHWEVHWTQSFLQMSQTVV